MPIFFEVAREDVEAGELSDYVESLRSASADTDLLGSVILVFTGYDDDPRAIWEVPEARRWFAGLTRAIPHLLYLLDPEAGMSKLYFALLLPSLELETLKPALEQSFLAAAEYLASVGVDESDPRVTGLPDKIVRSLVS